MILVVKKKQPMGIITVPADGKLKYAYVYDYLGRLIYSNQRKDGKITLYTRHQYDISNRLTLNYSRRYVFDV